VGEVEEVVTSGVGEAKEINKEFTEVEEEEGEVVRTSIA